MKHGLKLATERERLLLEKARQLRYKSAGEGDDLNIHFFLPADLKEEENRTAFLFFNGGAWDRGNVTQFAPQALYFVERGAVCGLVEYRNQSTHPDCSPIDALQDAQSAIRYLRYFAERLHVDPAKVVVVGASAGANIAANALMKGHVPPDRDDYQSADPQPNAGIFFSPIIDVEKDSYGADAFAEPALFKKASLTRFIDAGLPPMLMINGSVDRLIPAERVVSFCEEMKKRGNRCEHVPFEGRDHNFYNLNLDPVSYEACLIEMNRFLDETGFLERSKDGDGARLISWREQDY
ncbi:MAG: alpha/beta hydrolase [Verrucomicrobiota bacterium]